MAFRTLRVSFVAAALLLSAQPVARGDAARPEALTAPSHFVSGWVPYWGTAPSRAGMAAHPDAIGDVSPLFWGTKNDGTLQLLGPRSQLNETIAAKPPGSSLIVGIFDSTAPGVMSAILHDPLQRTSHVNNIVKLVMDERYDGIDLDYEVFAFDSGQRAIWGQIEEDWVSFVNQLSVELHNRGKLLSVTVPPVYVDENGNKRGYTVYAQGRIAPAVDRLRLMVYDWSTSVAGPIAPMYWVEKVIAYSSSVVPVSKLQLGVPAYGKHWVTKTSGVACPDGVVRTESVLMKNIDAVVGARGYTRLASLRGVSEDGAGERIYSWSETVSGPRTKPLPPPVVPPSSIVIAEIKAAATGTPLVPAIRLSTPSPLVTCTVQHTIYVPDAYTVDRRSDAAQAAGWRGIVIWAFGYESDSMYGLLAQ